MSDSGNTFAHKFLLASFMLLMTAVSILAFIGYSSSVRLERLEELVRINTKILQERAPIIEDFRRSLDKVEENE